MWTQVDVLQQEPIHPNFLSILNRIAPLHVDPSLIRNILLTELALP